MRLFSGPDLPRDPRAGPITCQLLKSYLWPFYKEQSVLWSHPNITSCPRKPGWYFQVQRVKGKCSPSVVIESPPISHMAGNSGNHEPHPNGVGQGQHKQGMEPSGTYQLQHHRDTLPRGFLDVISTIHQALITLWGTLHPFSLWQASPKPPGLRQGPWEEVLWESSHLPLLMPGCFWEKHSPRKEASVVPISSSSFSHSWNIRMPFLTFNLDFSYLWLIPFPPRGTRWQMVLITSKGAKKKGMLGREKERNVTWKETITLQRRKGDRPYGKKSGQGMRGKEEEGSKEELEPCRNRVELVLLRLWLWMWNTKLLQLPSLFGGRWREGGITSYFKLNRQHEDLACRSLGPTIITGARSG